MTAMQLRTPWSATPRERVEAECARRGKPAVAAGCVVLLAGDASDAELIVILGGGPAQRQVAGDAPPELAYWLRVWAARGLLWAWDASATEAVRGALGDEAWRVREMAAKVVARHLVGDLLGAVAELRGDPVARVRRAALRAVSRLTAAQA